MIKALIRTVLLIVVVLVLAQFVPFIAAHEVAILIAVVALGLIGIIGRIFIALLIVAALLVLFHPFF